MDAIRILGLKFNVSHGLYPEEKNRPQLFEVDVEIVRDLAKPAASDRIEDTVNYSQIVSLVRGVMEGEPCNLLERLAGKIADALRPVAGGSRLVVRVRKPNAPLNVSFDTVEVELQCEI